MLITGRTERTFKLSNGCACHSLSGELEEGLWQTLQETDGTDRSTCVVIEMSGAASDPSRVVESLARRYGKMTRARLDGVVLVVDADVLSPKVPACGESAERTTARCNPSPGLFYGSSCSTRIASCSTRLICSTRRRFSA